VIWGAQEFLDMVRNAAVERGWRRCPSPRSILACRAEALALNDNSGSRVVEIAAVFYALSHDERRTWPVRHGLPIAVLLRRPRQAPATGTCRIDPSVER